MKRYLFACLLVPCAVAAAGSSAWITDKLDVQMRAGPGVQYKVLKALPSGTALTVSEGEKDGFVRVVLESGEDGWVSTRYVSQTPVALADKEENAKRLASLQAENQRLRADLAALRNVKDNAEKSNQSLNAETARLNSEVVAIRQASANVLRIQNERDQLTQEKATLEGQLETLKREKQAMDASNQQDWFMIGAGVLFGGIVLGLILPRLSWRKKSSWDSF